MESKLFEVRVRGTNIPVMATRLDASNDAEAYLLGRSGYGKERKSWRGYIFLFPIEIDDLEPGAVLDVDYIEGRREKPRKPDRFWTEEDEDDG